MGVLDRESPILGNFAPPEAKKIRRIDQSVCVFSPAPSTPWHRRHNGRAHRPRIESACVDMWPSLKTGVLVKSFSNQSK